MRGEAGVISMVNFAVNFLKWNVKLQKGHGLGSSAPNHFSKSHIIKHCWYRGLKVVFPAITYLSSSHWK